MTPFTPSPELEGLLQEIAADPRSHLLRVERPDVYASLRDRQTMVSHRATGLLAAERELLRSYRFEAAHLLREAAVAHLCASSSAEDVIDRGTALERPFPLRPVADCEQDLDALPEEALAHQKLTGTQGRASASTDSLARALRLATASARVLPTDQTRIYVAVATTLSGQPRSALRHLDSILHNGSLATPDNRAFAWFDAACAEFRLGRLDRALVAYRRAALYERLGIEPMARWLITAVHLTLRPEAIRAAGFLDERIAVDEPSLQLLVDRDRRLQARGIWTPSEAGRRLAAGLADSLGPSSRRILDGVF